MRYSAIIPVYNRPDELEELLQSLTLQTFKDFEVIVVEDGSSQPAHQEANRYKNQLTIKYFVKENAGQGFARNYGFERAEGDWLLVFDSDAIIPETYFEEVDKFLNNHPEVKAFGGPDASHPSFTPMQKAISYSMTSLFTTGGIRGGEKRVGEFHPRSFNMGVAREVYQKIGGYKITRMGEDIEFSIRIIENGFQTALIPQAFIYHKRRTNLSQFYRQLHFFGRARINISRFYPNEIKLVHLFPAVFVAAWFLLFVCWLFFQPLAVVGTVLVVFYYLAIFIDSAFKNKSLQIGLLSIATSFVQLFAYGIGFYTEWLTKTLKS